MVACVYLTITLCSLITMYYNYLLALMKPSQHKTNPLPLPPIILCNDVTSGVILNTQFVLSIEYMVYTNLVHALHVLLALSIFLIDHFFNFWPSKGGKMRYPPKNGSSYGHAPTIFCLTVHMSYIKCVAPLLLLDFRH